MLLGSFAAGGQASQAKVSYRWVDSAQWAVIDRARSLSPPLSLDLSRHSPASRGSGPLPPEPPGPHRLPVWSREGGAVRPDAPGAGPAGGRRGVRFAGEKHGVGHQPGEGEGEGEERRWRERRGGKEEKNEAKRGREGERAPCFPFSSPIDPRS